MPQGTTGDYHWLTSPLADPYLAAAGGHSGSTVSLVKRLRAELSPHRAHLILETVQLRRRAAAKFPAADCMFFTRQLLEQSTGAQVAAYKASRFSASSHITDLCCGIGGDLLAFAARGPCVGVDRDPVAVLLADANCCAVERTGAGRHKVMFRTTDAAQYRLGAGHTWHLDPDRRATGIRTTQLEVGHPGPEAVSRLLLQSPHGAIKLASATNRLPANWLSETEREWIGYRGECRQQVVWFGDLAIDSPGRVATLLDNLGRPHRFVGSPTTAVPRTSDIGRFVFEPHAVVLAAGLVGALATAHQLASFSSTHGYLTGDHRVSNILMAMFEVEEVLPFNIKRLKTALRSRRIGRLEIKHRALAVNPSRLISELKLAGDRSATLLIAGAQPRAVAILSQRVTES